MPRTSGQERRGGRILPHQGDTNDNAAILGGDLAPGGDYHENYNETVKHEMSDKARKEYRCRIVKSEGHFVVGILHKTLGTEKVYQQTDEGRATV